MFIETVCIRSSLKHQDKRWLSCQHCTAGAPSASLRLRVGPRPRPFHDEGLCLVINLVHDSLLPDWKNSVADWWSDRVVKAIKSHNWSMSSLCENVLLTYLTERNGLWCYHTFLDTVWYHDNTWSFFESWKSVFYIVHCPLVLF